MAPPLSAFPQSRRWIAGVLLSGSLAGCAHHVAVAPVQSPVALHILPGAGYNLMSARTLYLVVVTQDLRTRNYVPELSTQIASELRSVCGANVIPAVDPGLDRPAGSSWRETCDLHGLPRVCDDPAAAVAFCELQELDPYSPVRVGLALRIRRLEDGLELAGAQGIWEGQPPVPPPAVPFWKFPWWNRPHEPEGKWTEIVEATTSTGVMRQASRDLVQALLTTPWSQPAVMPASAVRTSPDPGIVPPLPPAEGPLLPVPDELSESVESVPEAPGP